MIPGLGRSPGEGNSKPLQYSGLENPIDCIVLGVAKSQTQLSNFHYHFQEALVVMEKIHSHMVSLLKELFSDINATMRPYRKFILRELHTLV